MEPITMQRLDMRNPGRPDHQCGPLPIHPLDPTLSHLPSHGVSMMFRNPPMDFAIKFTHATTKFSEVGNTVWVLWDQYLGDNRLRDFDDCTAASIGHVHIAN